MITIGAVGKLKRGPLRDVFDGYAGRLRWPLKVHEIDPSKAATAALRREAEAQQLVRTLDRHATVVALDEGGQNLASEALAHKIEQWQVEARTPIAFAIGGADGLAPGFVTSADLVLSFGRATWPHLLVRAMLVEQIYRAETLLKGHPYHRGG